LGKWGSQFKWKGKGLHPLGDPDIEAIATYISGLKIERITYKRLSQKYKKIFYLRIS